MGLFLWDDAYSIGIAEIDQQHKSMFTTMHTLHESMLTGQSGARMGPTLKDLREACELHFRTEEALMAFHGFPDLGNHCAEHRLIREQLRLFQSEHEAGKPGLIIDIVEYMEDWQGIHVLQHDMRYRDYLMQQWGIQFKQHAANYHLDGEPRSTGDARRFPRLACALPVELRSLMDAPIVFAKCVNISQSGAFLRTWSPLSVNTSATARFQLGTSVAEVRVCVRRSEPCIGMGISFASPLPQRLRDFICDLEQAQTQSGAPVTQLTCERLLHDCMQNLTALEDVIAETEISNDTVVAVRSLLNHARRLERLADIHR